jgi:hypothetical protein
MFKTIEELLGMPSSRVGFKNIVEFEHRRAGKLIRKGRSKNLVVNGGLDWLKGLMSNGGSGQALYIGCSAATITPSASDTALSGELTTNGFARAAAAYAAGGTGVFTLQVTFTATGTQTVASAGLFTALAGGVLFAEVPLSTSASLVSGDTLQITWTVTLTGS